MRKDRLDGTGFAALLGVALLLAVNQIIVKEVNQGLQPVFFAGARSALATPLRVTATRSVASLTPIPAWIRSSLS